YLTPEEYGVSAIANTFAVLIAGPFSLGTVNSLGVSYFNEPDAQRRGHIIWTAVALVGLNVIVCGCVCIGSSALISRLLFGTISYSRLITLATVAVGAQCVADPLWA